MSHFKAIRERLGVTQDELAAVLGCSQGNVSLMDRGQTVMPDTAKKLLEFAALRGLVIQMDHVYGLLPLPTAQ